MKLKKLLTLLLIICLLAGVTNTPIKTEASTTKSYTSSELRLLTAIIYCEAGWESYKGKVAVGNVILNRVESNKFDHVTTIREAVYDLKRWGRQFEPVYILTSSGKYTPKGAPFEKALKLYTYGNYKSEEQKKVMEECKKAAKAALNGTNVIGDYLYFNSHIASTKAKCVKAKIPYKIIGNHIFFERFY
ncbi:cell wall hydrolase [Lachnoclostridium phytofermentans]|mgnify:CR=1|uniref:cell wall hydrolase n=1 Tax=Lachnoclostridium phytofermentans TaxID=66219 RepID=UPI000496EC93|nr:cell wall hydrolase [Lachnoclostridium phytofermentans]